MHLNTINSKEKWYIFSKKLNFLCINKILYMIYFITLYIEDNE